MVVGVAFYGLEKIDKSLSNYNELSTDSNLSGYLQADMLMVRMFIKGYLINKSDKDLEQYQEYYSKVQALLSSADKEINKPERVALLNDTKKLIEVYNETFEEVVDLIEQRNVVDKNGLVHNGDKMRKAIDSILVSAHEDQDSKAVYYASQVQKEMLSGSLFVNIFLQSNQQDDYNEAFDFINGRLQESVVSLDSELQNPERRKSLNNFKIAHESYSEAMKKIHGNNF